MAIVTFWNNDREQSGKTLTAVAVATKMAIERNYKILLISTSFQDATLRNCFWKNETQRTLKAIEQIQKETFNPSAIYLNNITIS